jgi:hypothetical protein
MSACIWPLYAQREQLLTRMNTPFRVVKMACICARASPGFDTGFARLEVSPSQEIRFGPGMARLDSDGRRGRGLVLLALCRAITLRTGQSGSAGLAASQLSCRVGTDSAGRLAPLFLLRDPVADVLDIVEDEATYFRARRTQAASSQALQGPHGTIQLPRRGPGAQLGRKSLPANSPPAEMPSLFMRLLEGISACARGAQLPARPPTAPLLSQ